jgi:hypothetical protein
MRWIFFFIFRFLRIKSASFNRISDLLEDFMTTGGNSVNFGFDDEDDEDDQQSD